MADVKAIYTDHRGNEIEITAGMPATMGIGSDRYAYEVVEIIDDRTVTVRRMESNGQGGYVSNLKAGTEHVRLVTRRGRSYWGRASRRTQRGWDVSDSYRFHFGRAETYLDPSF